MTSTPVVIQSAIALLGAAFLFPGQGTAQTANFGSTSGLHPRPAVQKPARVQIGPGYRHDLIQVKFRDGLQIRLREGQLTDLGTGVLDEARATIAIYSSGTWERAHALAEVELDRLRENAQRNQSRVVADLNLHYFLSLPPNAVGADAIDAFNALDAVELASRVPVPALPPFPPNYQSQQGYLGPAPGGIGAAAEWVVPGGTGSMVRIADLEYSWNLQHEDLPVVTLLGAQPSDPFNDNNHGTAVLGEMLSLANNWGVTGASYGAMGFVVAVNTGPQGNSDSHHPSNSADGRYVSADGRFVAFYSSASNLVAGDTNGREDVFVRDRETATTQRVSVSTGAVQGNLHSGEYGVSISADGRFVAFYSLASNLVAGDTNSTADIFVRDRQSATTQRVSVSTSGAQGNSSSYYPSISADGRFVTFYSLASNLVAGDVNGTTDVFVRDRQNGTTECVSVDPSGVQGYGSSVQPSISADGRFVAFWSTSNNLVPGDTNADYDVFVRDRQSATTQRVSVSTGGVEGNTASGWPSISADGRFVAFFSGATNLVAGDTNATWDVFVHNRQSGTTERVSVATSGVQGNLQSRYPSISSDGRYVSFTSDATNLVAVDTNGTPDIFVRDRQMGTTERVSVASGGVQGNAASSSSSISADGIYVSFDSVASNLAASDTNGFSDVFVRDRQSGSTERVSFGPAIYNLAGAITTALGSLQAGDVILIEQQIPGPNYSPPACCLNSPPNCSPGTDCHFGLVPTEWDLNTYNAIITAVGNGVIVVEAAGNGSQNLDDPVYSQGNAGHWPFLPQNDSGAIVVGAGAVPGGSDVDRSRLGFSNHGSTVDLQGWGEDVVTIGYGDLFSTEGVNRWYTSAFGGTSGASPNIASACAILESVYKAQTGSFLTPAEVRVTLRHAGSPQQSGTFPASQNIGPRPDIPSAVDLLFPQPFCSPGQDGVIACPCANPPAGINRGCENSSSTGGASLWAAGSQSLSADSLTFTTGGERPTALRGPFRMMAS